MPSPNSPALQALHRLNLSSPDSHGKLSDVLYGEEYAQCVLRLEDEDLVWLINYLEKVRHKCHAAMSRLPLKPVQVLDCLDPFSLASRKCLRELRSICSTRVTLPPSYALPSQLLKIDSLPFTSGGFGDVYMGTLDGSKICVKRIRVYTKDVLQTAVKVYFRRPQLAFPSSLTNL